MGRLSLHDAVLINAMAALVLNVVPTREDRRDAFVKIRTVLPKVSRDQALIGALADAADWIVRSDPRDRGGVTRQELEAREVLIQIFNVRAGQAWGQIEERDNVVSETAGAD